jgi:ornithine cyclodeaminase
VLACLSAVLLMLGAGQLSPHLAMADCAVRPIREVGVWNRNAAKAQQMAAAQQLPGVQVEVADDLESAVRWADVISAATMAKEP